MAVDVAAFLAVDLVETLAQVEAVDPEWWRSASSRVRDDPVRLAKHLLRQLPPEVLLPTDHIRSSQFRNVVSSYVL